MKTKMFVTAFLFAIGATSVAHAEESVLKHCEGWIPAYFVDLVKIENGNQVQYQVNIQGEVTNFQSLAQAQKDFDNKCATVKSWE